MKIYVVMKELFEESFEEGVDGMYTPRMLKAFYSREEAEKFCESCGDFIEEVELE